MMGRKGPLLVNRLNSAVFGLQIYIRVFYYVREWDPGHSALLVGCRKS